MKAVSSNASLMQALALDDEDDLLDNPECPICGGPGVPLGGLGRLSWFRCQDCGMDFNESVTAVSKIASDDLGPGSGGMVSMIQSMLTWLRGSKDKDAIPPWFPKKLLVPQEIATGRWIKSDLGSFASLPHTTAASGTVPSWHVKTDRAKCSECGHGEHDTGLGCTWKDCDCMHTPSMEKAAAFGGPRVGAWRGDPDGAVDDHWRCQECDGFRNNPRRKTCGGCGAKRADQNTTAARRIHGAWGIFRMSDKTPVYGPVERTAVEMAMESGRYPAGEYFASTMKGVGSAPIGGDPFSDVEVKGETPAYASFRRREAKVQEIIGGLKSTNPGLAPKAARKLAIETVTRFPQMFRGG